MSKANPLGKLATRAARTSSTPAADQVPPAQAAQVRQARGAGAGEGAGEVVHGKRRRGTEDVVSMTVRLRRADWTRLGELRLTEGKSAQEVFLEGLAAVFAKYGFEPPQAP